jgi:hypothetical protein
MADRPRLLARDSTRGYTDDPGKALRHEPGAVPRDYANVLVSRAHRDQAAARQLQRSELGQNGFYRRLVLAQAQARHTGVDIHGRVRLLRLAMEQRRSEAHLERRLQAIERMVWPDLPAQ